MRTILDLAAGQPWLITEDGLDQVLAIAAREASDIDAMRQALAARAASPEAVAMRRAPRLDGTYDVGLRDGVAVIPVIGPIFRYANLLTELSGATSTQRLAQNFQAALDSPQAHAIVLNIDSPGGQAPGIAELAAQIAAARGQKPIVAYAGDMAASAAYWLATAAGEIVLSETALVGSIGAVMVGTDTSQRDAAQGVRRYKITSAASPLKALDPSTRAGEDQVRAIVDALAEKFIAAVAANRAVSSEMVRQHFGQGGLVPRPEDAIARGMANRIGQFEELLGSLAGGEAPRGSIALPRGISTMAQIETTEALTAAYPGLVEQVRASAASAAVAALTAETVRAQHPRLVDLFRAEGRETAVTEERERIARISARTLPGHAELRDRAIAGGMSYADFLEAQTAAEQETGGRQLARLREDEKQQPRVPPTTPTEPAADADLPIEERVKAQWDKSPALRAEFAGDFAACLAYHKRDAEGLIRRLTSKAG